MSNPRIQDQLAFGSAKSITLIVHLTLKESHAVDSFHFRSLLVIWCSPEILIRPADHLESMNAVSFPINSGLVLRQISGSI